MKHYIESIKGKNTLVILCTIIGVLFNILFYNKLLGINYFVFVVTLIISFMWLCHKSKIHIHSYLISYLLISLLLASNFLFYGNIFIKTMNFILIPIIILFSSLKSLQYKLNINLMVSQLLGSLGKIHIYFKTILGYLNFKEKNIRIMGIFIGLLISIPLLLILIPLMGSADAVFKYLVNDIISALENIKIEDYIYQLIMVIGMASFIFAYIIQLNTSNTEEKTINRVVDKTVDIENKHLLLIANITILSIMCTLYFIFSIVQFKYLFLGNVSNISNFSYSEYARSGFFQMLLLTLINFLVIMISRYNMKDEVNRKKIISNIFMTMLVLFNYVLIASSFYRMFLYESTYGYTMLRLWVYLALIIESIIMIILLVGIWKTTVPVIQLILIITLIFYCGINIMSMDAFIAKKNIDRYYEKGDIDLEYLNMLSYDTYPQLERLLESNNEEVKQKVIEIFINSDLKDTYNWQEYNYSRAKAIEIIKNYK